MATTVLLTGFGPFGAVRENPSAALVARLDGEEIAGATVRGVILDVATERVGGQLTAAIAAHRPAMVLGTGVAAGRCALAFERVAVNLRDFAIADVDGAQPCDVSVVEGAPDGLLATLPLRAMLTACRDAAVPAYLSLTAGAYVCNQLFYLAVLAGRRDGFAAGFLHLPLAPSSVPPGSEAPVPTMELETMERGLRAALLAALAPSGG
ncbi:MAG: hypothetical protein M0004_14630 [Actinomycetota bacterium]|nr:hypothetical protein [Actinomycetota bacterium]